MIARLLDLADWIRTSPGKSLSLAAAIPLVLIGLELGEFKASAEDAHRTAAELEKVVDGLVNLEEKRNAVAEERERQERARLRELSALCRAEVLVDRDRCAQVEADLR